jgi:hypothetical protein
MYRGDAATNGLRGRSIQHNVRGIEARWERDLWQALASAEHGASIPSRPRRPLSHLPTKRSVQLPGSAATTAQCRPGSPLSSSTQPSPVNAASSYAPHNTRSHPQPPSAVTKSFSGAQFCGVKRSQSALDTSVTQP